MLMIEYRFFTKCGTTKQTGNKVNPDAKPVVAVKANTEQRAMLASFNAKSHQWLWIKNSSKTKQFI